MFQKVPSLGIWRQQFDMDVLSSWKRGGCGGVSKIRRGLPRISECRRHQSFLTITLFLQKLSFQVCGTNWCCQNIFGVYTFCHPGDQRSRCGFSWKLFIAVSPTEDVDNVAPRKGLHTIQIKIKAIVFDGMSTIQVIKGEGTFSSYADKLLNNFLHEDIQPKCLRMDVVFDVYSEHYKIRS